MEIVRFCLVVFVCAAVGGCAQGGVQMSPPQTSVVFHTTAGDITVLVAEPAAPKGAARFLELVKDGYYNNNAFFRVVPQFVVQWGINGDPSVSQKWVENKIPDDPVRLSNKKGTITFAMAGPNSRTTQLFINFVDNTNLDSMGFAPFGHVTAGMDVAEKIFSGYGEKPQQDMIYAKGNEYLSADFPNLDYIKSAEIVQLPSDGVPVGVAEL